MKHTGFISLSTDGHIFHDTLRDTAKASKDALMGCEVRAVPKHQWKQWYKRGYRCYRCRITLTTRKG